MTSIDPKVFTDAKLMEEKSSWQKYRVESEPPEEEPLVSIQYRPVCTRGNHSLVIGKKKSRKTLFIVLLVSWYMANMEDILICDSEQGARHVWKIRERIYQLTGKYITILALRGESIAERRRIIEQAIDEGNFRFVVIDGIRDLLSNINDPDQCTELVTWLEKLTLRGLHVVNVLHQNKTDNNARGHLGSELLNKAECTIELERDEKANCSIVRCESSRDIPFESFAFTHNLEGLPELVSMPIKGQSLSENEQKERLQLVFDGNPLKRGELIERIKVYFKLGKTRAEYLLGDFERLKWIMKTGKDRSPNAVYKLAINCTRKSSGELQESLC